MSKLISTEEIMATHNEERGLLQGERQVAKAQRDSSDKEWLKSGEELSHQYQFDVPDVVKFWQALKLRGGLK